MSRLNPGDVLGDRYEIAGVLGEGGMGTVYEATHRTLGSRVAVKTLHGQYSKDLGYRSRFNREARVTASLNHPNAVDVIDFGAHGDTLYLVMEFLEGPSLREVQQEARGRFDYPRLHRLASALADVLRVAHGLPLIHRDLKPENIMVEEAGTPHERPVVVDFGLAFIEDSGEELGRMTETGVVVGTPLYIAPEQAEGLEIDEAVDVYSLGCIFYELASGKPPFMGRSTLQIINGHLFKPPRPLVGMVDSAEIPTSFAHLVMSMLNKMPQTRPSAAEVLETLEQIAPGSHGRQRARGRTALQDRGERAVTLEPAPGATDTAPMQFGDTTPIAPGNQKALRRLASGETLRPLAVHRFMVDDEVIQQFAANGVDVVEREEGQVNPGDVAVLSPSATPEEVAALAAEGLPVIVAADPGDMKRVQAMLRAGAAEIIGAPVVTRELIRKTLRAIRKANRKRGGHQ